MSEAIFILSSLVLVIVGLTGWAAKHWVNRDDDVVKKIDALLPQTQCAQCGYPGCRPYAQAIARGEADINQCPPGGQAGVDALAELLGKPSLPLNDEHGTPKPPMIAIIDEARCIGCTLCIQACPVDAIFGAQKQMHTIIASECTGCELCLAPCPVDCIDMIPVQYRPSVHKPDALSIRIAAA